jgi:mono/diheme cytochrome c family protein
LLALAGAAALRPRPAASGETNKMDAGSGLTALLGSDARQRHAAELRSRKILEKAFTWERYSDWGRELLVNGQVKSPPYGAGPSAPLAKAYRCVHCHNLRREDEKLTEPDPEARARYVLAEEPAEPERRDGKTLSLTPGTTLWGAVNRGSYYNGTHSRYRGLKLDDGARVDPTSLADAVKVCCRYSSGGRFPEGWELDSILTHLWDLEVRLRDLGLAEAAERKVLDAVNGGRAGPLGEARGLLRRSFLREAEAKKTPRPSRAEGDRVEYGKAPFNGDARLGEFLYRSACAGCHAAGGVNDVSGAKLVADDGKFHKLVWDGSEPDGAYMPFFSAQRLSQQQAADIRAYLRATKK